MEDVQIQRTDRHAMYKYCEKL